MPLTEKSFQTTILCIKQEEEKLCHQVNSPRHSVCASATKGLINREQDIIFAVQHFCLQIKHNYLHHGSSKTTFDRSIGAERLTYSIASIIPYYSVHLTQWWQSKMSSETSTFNFQLSIWKSRKFTNNINIKLVIRGFRHI